MSHTLDAFLRSWPSAPLLAASSIIVAGVYVRGWCSLHRRDPQRWHAGRLAAFLGSLAVFYLALASPIEPFATLLLSVHMLQHLLLMMVAPPLVWLGWPLFPLVRGLPQPVRTYWIAPLLRWPPLRDTFSFLTQPVVAWLLFVATTWLWHTPPGYELGLVNDNWHVIEHACFVASALLFWYPVVRPYPSRQRWSPWLLFPYLLLADVQNTLLAAWLTFSPRVLYPFYLQVPRIDGLSALADQQIAGVLMWVPGSITFLVPLFWIAVRFFLPGGSHGYASAAPGRIPAEAGSAGSLRRRTTIPHGAFVPARLPAKPQPADMLYTPYVGRFLRWRHGRLLLQLVLSALAGVVVYDGLRGPQVAPMNMAGVLPWIHWRGILILTLLVAGNMFCMACPFTLPRSLARAGGRPLRGRRWPRWLRSKWLAVALVAIFLWSYEAFALWDRPSTTAWIVIGYFVAAFVVDRFFTGAAFCKYVCPIGQFNFVQSLLSPLEVTVRQPAVCASCATRECIRGSDTIPGCEMHLFQPRKDGNFDCTFCLDCVHACPHQNVGLLAAVPGRSLWTDRLRSGIGRFSRRPDLAALVLLLVFGAFANAAGMIEPVVEWQDRLRLRIGDPAPLVITSGSYVLAIIVIPFLAAGFAGAWSRRWDPHQDPWITTATRYAFALVPIGFAMWLAHYSFHLFASWETIVPATQRFAVDCGWSVLGEPHWQCSCCSSVAPWITQLQVLMLDVGLLASLYAGFRIAEANTTSVGAAVRAFAPWGMIILLLFMFGVWIVFQPMEMRGTLPIGT